MLAKDFFDNVSLVGLRMDNMLYHPDFRALKEVFK
jgi:primosomal protein N'